MLIVDDDVDPAELFGLLLERAGYETRLTHDAAEAVLTAHAFLPDVAILNVGLPAMDGYELIRLLRTTSGTKPCRFIALIASSAHELVERSQEAGFEALLTKPIASDELLHSVAAAAAQQRGSAGPDARHAPGARRSAGLVFRGAEPGHCLDKADDVDGLRQVFLEAGR